MISLAPDRHDVTRATAIRSTNPPATGTRALPCDPLGLIEGEPGRRR
jgi:hypothetical protein